MQIGEVNVAFREPMHKIVNRIKNKPFFRWPKKMGEDPSRRNQNLYCTYHRDKGHTTKQCRVLKDHLGQLVKAGHLKEFIVEFGNRGARLGDQQKGNPFLPPLGVINFIHAVPRGTNSAEMRIFVVASMEPIAFDDKDPEGTIQPHDDVLVVTAWIGGFLVKRVMID